MGRVSAGIAHEIRNPLAAIAQANALLREEGGNAAEQQMLTAMVADNVERLKRIVDDVMEVAPGAGANPRPIDLGAEVGRIVADWARTSHVALGLGSRLRVDLPHDALPVLFDAEHLRRVLVNLLDNARRYASDRPGAIELVAEARGGGQARLSVASDGEPIPPDIEPFLFEPFFSTRDAQPRYRVGPVYLPRVVRALRRQHRLLAASGRRAALQRVRRDDARGSDGLAGAEPGSPAALIDRP
jgi:two-component system sensor histidine kinase PilS (NtrC family)